MNNFSPSLIRDRRHELWRTGSLGAHVLQEHLPIHSTLLSRPSHCARLWARGQGANRDQGRHTLSSLELSLARETKILMCVLRCDKERLPSSATGSLWLTSTESMTKMRRRKTRTWTETMTTTCIFYLKTWWLPLSSFLLRNVKMPFTACLLQERLAQGQILPTTNRSLRMQRKERRLPTRRGRSPLTGWFQRSAQTPASSEITVCTALFSPRVLLFTYINILTTHLFLCFFKLDTMACISGTDVYHISSKASFNLLHVIQPFPLHYIYSPSLITLNDTRWLHCKSLYIIFLSFTDHSLNLTSIRYVTKNLTAFKLLKINYQIYFQKNSTNMYFHWRYMST